MSQNLKSRAALICGAVTVAILLGIPLLYASAIPLAPITSDLRDEILGVTQQAASVGFGEDNLIDVDARVFALNLVRRILAWLGLILIAVILYGGFIYMTAGGSEEKIGKAKGIIFNALIGTALVLSSYAIVFFIARTVQRTIFQNLGEQVRNCAYVGGTTSCCPEFAAFQDAGIVGADPEENRRVQRERYDEWRECVDRENPF